MTLQIHNSYKVINKLKVNLLAILSDSDPLFKKICLRIENEAKTKMDAANKGLITPIPGELQRDDAWHFHNVAPLEPQKIKTDAKIQT